MGRRIMLTWISKMLEKCQDSLAKAKTWLDTEIAVKNRVVVLTSTGIVMLVLLVVII
jgi:hypothetical protein